MFTLPNHHQLVEVCREYGIRQLDVFGSTVRTLEAAHDVDFPVDEQR